MAKYCITETVITHAFLFICYYYDKETWVLGQMLLLEKTLVTTWDSFQNVIFNSNTAHYGQYLQLNNVKTWPYRALTMHNRHEQAGLGLVLQKCNRSTLVKQCWEWPWYQQYILRIFQMELYVPYRAWQWRWVGSTAAEYGECREHFSHQISSEKWPCKEISV